MAIKVSGGYKCGYCKKLYPNQVEADGCKSSHNLIYVALSMEDLNRIIQFMYTKDDDLLGENLVQTLQSYLRTNFIREYVEEKDGSKEV